MNSIAKNEFPIAMLILAAGGSSRMEGIKQLLSWNNSTLLGSAITTGLNSDVKDVFVVLGANPDKILNCINTKNAHFIYHPNWEEGMGSTLAFGVQNILKINDNYKAILIALSDQPVINVEYINNLISKALKFKKNIIVSNYGKNVGGVPAIFGSKYFSELKKN